MLSILIPIYNFDVRDFVHQLEAQCATVSVETEILLLDDASEEEFRKVNAPLELLPHVNYRQLETNVGRSSIRNQLVDWSKFEQLLILDCDGKCPDELFVKRYIDHMDVVPVMYGGREYPPREAEKGVDLHWTYGSQRESVEAYDRMDAPYRAFMTNNFLILKSTYQKVRMDESLNGYGHEDTLFALELQRAGFEVGHIHNPLIHIGLESSDAFLTKTNQGIENLAMLNKNGKITEGVKLLEAYLRFKNLGMAWLLILVSGLLNPLIERQLRSTSPSLKAFDFYKLGQLARAMGKKS